MQLGLVGTTFRRVGQTGLQSYWAADPSVLSRLKDRCQLGELVYLATCNRVEFVFTCGSSMSVAACRDQIHAFFQQTAADKQAAATALHAYAGEGAAEHLFEVAASIDSMMPGETQILGQVKTALRQAQKHQLCGPELGLVFEEAFTAAKRVRHQTRLGTGTVSMLSLAEDSLKQILQPPASLAVIGAGDMAEQCGTMFGKRADLSLWFINRSVERAQALAARFGGRAMSLTQFLDDPPACQAIVTATAAPAPFLGEAFFARLQARGQAPWIVDLAVERDACPQAAAQYGIHLVDLDRLATLADQGQAARQGQVAQARLVVAEALVGYRRRMADRGVGPVVRALRQQVQDAVEQEMQVHGAADWPEAARLRAALVARLSHGPTVALKKIAFEHGLEVVDTYSQALMQSRQRPRGAK